MYNDLKQKNMFIIIYNNPYGRLWGVVSGWRGSL